ncbi:DGQHR domain-containing protein [Deltaproteobacteria bacterium]|nr:DGQHR domain-containing protein [Deltaproteobacteria bacterium]
MAYGFENTTSDPSEISSILRLRRKPHIEKTVKASIFELVKKKAELEEKDGWSILQQNKKSIRMKKEKHFDEKLEDVVWSILARMGFDELSKDRQFKINVGDNIPDRQIDVFAKDEETVLFIECTACEERKRKSLANLIAKIVSIRKKIFDNAQIHYGLDLKLQMKWGIATRNIEWFEVDENKCEEENIFFLKDFNIEYYSRLVNHLKEAAKYQLLAQIFRNEKIKGLSLVVPATRGKEGRTIFYNFLLKPYDLLKIAYISHKKGDDVDDFDTYQRMLTPSRLKKIGKYIDDGGQFPTNIVVNIKSPRSLRFDKQETIGTSAYGQLYLPSQYASVWIIDGQHRLYGYSYSERSMKKASDTTVFPVLAYVNLPSDKEAEMFISINCEQVKVSRNLLNEIYSGLKWDSDDFKDRIDGLCSRIAMNLNRISSSPIFQRIIVTNTKKTNHRCLTINSFVDGLKENRLFGEENKDGVTPSHLSASYSPDLKITLNKALLTIEHYLNLFKSKLNEHWILGDAPGGFLCTNNGIRALLRVLKEIFDHVEYENGEKLHRLKAEDLFKDIEKYTYPLLKYFKDLSPDEFTYYRNRTALKGVNQNTIRMLSKIHEEFKEFHPKKLEKYLEKIDEEGTQEAKLKIDEIIRKMYEFVIGELIEKHGDNWWYEGVPSKVRERCASEYEKGKGKKEKEQYLKILDYQAIASKEWGLFQECFTMSKEGGKEKKLKWLVELNDIRNVTHHAEKWPAEKEQVQTIRKMHKHVMEKFV